MYVFTYYDMPLMTRHDIDQAVTRKMARHLEYSLVFLVDMLLYMYHFFKSTDIIPRDIPKQMTFFQRYL